MEKIFNPNIEIKEFLYKHKEQFALDYSINFLESYAQKLIDLIEKWNSKEQNTFEKTSFVKHKILNFKFDFCDNLPNRYDNKVRKHREKWTIEKQKINDFKSEFLKIYDDFYNK